MSARTDHSWYKLTRILNCGDESYGQRTLKCMRERLLVDIVNAVNAADMTNMSFFGPTPDEKVVFSNYPDRLATGNFIKAPILVGLTDDEEGLSALAGVPRGVVGRRSLLQRRQKPGSPAALMAEMACGPHAAADGRVKQGIPAWRYLYKGVYPNQDIGSKGAWHGADVGMVFGTSEFLSHKVSYT
jgi:cholinesterase